MWVEVMVVVMDFGCSGRWYRAEVKKTYLYFLS